MSALPSRMIMGMRCWSSGGPTTRNRSCVMMLRSSVVFPDPVMPSTIACIILVKLDFTIHEIGHEDLHRRAAGRLRNLVDDFLWKGMEQQRAVSFPRTDDCVQGLAPAAPVLLLSVSPRSNDRPQSLKLFARPLFVSVDGTSGGVAPRACFVPG